MNDQTDPTGNRSRIGILVNILTVAERPTIKTHIMYKANLSHRQLEKYLAFLKQKEMLREFVDDKTGNRVYETTEKGNDFLKEYGHFSKTYGNGTMRQ